MAIRMYFYAQNDEINREQNGHTGTVA
jgi:hypothetical protein